MVCSVGWSDEEPLKFSFKHIEKPLFHRRMRGTPLYRTQWRSEAKCRPEPTLKVPPFPPVKFAYKNFK